MNPPTTPASRTAWERMTEDQREFWSERAAIREHCGGLATWPAEQGALEDTREWVRNRRRSA